MNITAKTSKNRIVTTAISAALAVTVVATTLIPDANAGRRERLFFGGVAAGIVGTAIIANEVRRNREDREDDYDRESRWERHVRLCEDAYQSYDENTDTYITFSGNERRCRK